MEKKIKEVDAYISRAKPFAQPILVYIRDVIHASSHEITEVIKWGFPNFEYKGNICYMASFKEHCTLGFSKAAVMRDEDKIFSRIGKTAMGSLGKITNIKDLPSKKILAKYIKEAIELNEKGVSLPKKKNTAKSQELTIPEDLAEALGKNKKAKLVFEQLAPSHKKEYVMWINEAKRESTRIKRIETTVEWVAEGKGRNWKYEKK